MSKNLKMNNFSIDEEKLLEIAEKKNVVTLKVDKLVAEHKHYSAILKDLTEEYFKILGVNTNE